MAFKKATKEQGRLRLAVSSPAGAGKTFTALRIGRRLAEHYGGRVALIDTEHGSASKYADKFDFDADELHPPFTPERYIQKIREAEAAGYKVLIIDSASHEWSGPGGCLEMVDAAARKDFKGNKWAAWSEVTPAHDMFIQAILTSGMHIIATLRSKTETAQTNEGGRAKVEKLGMAAIAREGTDYEFDIVGEIDTRHRMAITKTRCEALVDREFPFPGEDVADLIIAWLTDGAPVDPKAKDQAPAHAPESQAPSGSPGATRDLTPSEQILDWWHKQVSKQDKKPIEPQEAFLNRAREVRDAILTLPQMDTVKLQAVLQILTGKTSLTEVNVQQLRVLESMAEKGLLDKLLVLVPAGAQEPTQAT